MTLDPKMQQRLDDFRAGKKSPPAIKSTQPAYVARRGDCGDDFDEKRYTLADQDIPNVYRLGR